MVIKKFNPLVIASGFFMCSMPLNLDTYRSCPFKCEYCFMKHRVIGKRHESIPPNLHWLRYKFEKVYDKEEIDSSNFIEMLLKNRIDLHCGTKSEPFQPLEKKAEYTKSTVDICNEYNQHILFTTKTDSTYNVALNPEYHSFQLSVTTHYNDQFLEPNVPELKKRIDFYNSLKDQGFKVGIRIAPFIPNVTQIDKILELFDEVDFVNISRLRLLPQHNNKKLLEYIGANQNEYTTRGATSLKEEIAYSYLKPYFEYLDEKGYSWSCGFLNLGNNSCCCGDNLTYNVTKFDPLHLKEKYDGFKWNMDDGLNCIGEYKQCKCDMLYTSNRRHGNVTVEDFYCDRWSNHRSKFNPNFKFVPPQTLDDY